MMNNNEHYYYGGMHMGWWFFILVIVLGIVGLIISLEKKNKTYHLKKNYDSPIEL